MSSVPSNGMAIQSNCRLGFGDFEYISDRRELRKNGIRVRLQPQPLAILLALLESPGKVVRREELRMRLWGSATFVEFEQGLNSAIKRLRDVLCDSADNPRYVETVAREGYRFIAEVKSLAAVAAPSAETAQAPISSLPVAGPHLARRRRWPWAAGVALAIAIAVAFVIFPHWSQPTKRKLNFQARDWVLITNFENRTGEAVLDGTLEYALERELSNSQFVNVVPRERIDDTLRLMRKPLDTKIDAALGREICLRDGGIPVLLTGRVDKLGSTYVLSAKIVNAATGLTAASLSEDDPAESQMAVSVRRLSNRMREALGEGHEAILENEQQLEKVTTPSLRALQLYTQANQLMRRGDDQGAAAELLKQAVAEDPNFASAHLLLAWTYWNANEELTAQARSEFDRALALAGITSQRERLFIVGSYYDAVKAEPAKAIQAYEALVRLYPDHYWATDNLMWDYHALARLDDASKLRIRMAELNPWNLIANLYGAWGTAIVEQDWKGAQPYIERSTALAALVQDRNHRQYSTTWLKLLKIHETWSQGNVREAYEALVRDSETLDPLQKGKFLMTFGKLSEAEEEFQALPTWREPEVPVGALLFVRGDWPKVQDFLPKEQNLRSPDPLPYMLMARAGMSSYVEKAIRKGDYPSSSGIIRGELALEQGRTGRAIRLLEGGLNSSLSAPNVEFFLGCESLARAYESQGKLGQALRILQQASAEKTRTYVLPELNSGTFAAGGSFAGGGSFAWAWMKTELQLADLYRKMGRIPEAEKIENELFKLLIYADSDHPILRALQERSRQRLSLQRN